MFTMKESKTLNTGFSVYFILLPFVFIPFLIDSFILPRQLLTNLFLFVIIFLLFKKYKSANLFVIDSSAFFYLGFIFFSGLSFLNTQIVDISHAVFSKYLTFFIFFILIKYLLTSGLIKIEQIQKNVIYFGILSIVLATLAFINKTIKGQDLSRQVDLISGTFGNKNLLSSILFICLPFYFIGTSFSKKYKWLSFSAIGWTILLLILLRTRTVLIALGLFLFLVIFDYIGKRLSKKVKLITTSILIIFIGIVTFLLIFKKAEIGTNSKYFNRLFASETLHSRMEFWNQSGLIIKDNFFGGVGVGNWIDIYPKYGLDNFSSSEIQNGKLIINNTHNDFFQVFVETGFFGFICYLGFFLVVIYRGFCQQKNEQDSKEKRNNNYLLFMVISYLIIAFFDFPLARIEHQIILLVALAILQSKHLILGNRSQINLPIRYVLIGCFILLGYSTLINFYRMNGEMHLSKAFQEEKKGDNASFVHQLNLAKNFLFKTDNYALPIDWHLGKVNFRESNFKGSLENYKDAYKINPYSIVVNNDLATAFVKNNQTDSAVVYYKKALKISSNYLDARTNLAATYFNANQFEKAFETIDACDLNTNFDSYNQILIPIVEKKLNIELEKLKDDNLNSFLQAKIKSEDDLIRFYFDYKNNKTTFDKYLQSLTN